MDYKNGLNEKQYEAVTTTSQYCRVIAGAGSGKTRVLTYRIAYLIDEKHYSPRSILAITFTNKAANEMKGRVAKILGDDGRLVQLTTFHSFCAQFLRREIERVGVTSNFTILDDDDQKSIIKSILKEEGYQAKDPIGKELPSYIGAKKNKGQYPDDIPVGNMNANERSLLQLYRRYEEKLSQSSALDFDDLLLVALSILEDYPEVRSKWRKYFTNILVDEFQDTNDIQYRIIRNLLGAESNLFVVGDPDQTIYTWRGANQNIIIDLEHEFKVHTVTLEENYRSTKEILTLANNLIANNSNRMPKELYTKNPSGDKVVCKCFNSQYDEAQYVTKEIKRLVNEKDYIYKNIVILYRANYLTLPYEKSLMHEKIAYRIYGGQKFYQRREVKDLLAYLRLTININDDISLERIFNVPRRGIGDGTIEKLKALTIEHKLSFADFIKSDFADNCTIQKKQIENMRDLIGIIEKYSQQIADKVFMGDVVNDLISELDYYAYLKTADENGEERIENVKVLISDIIENLRPDKETTLDEYLQNISLMSSQDYVQEENVITLMTIHTAKGLEYPAVFLVSMNEGVFPNPRSVMESIEGLEEERRLCYVAYTRAMERLYITSHFNNFRGAYSMESPFIAESGIKGDRPKIVPVPTIFQPTEARKPSVSMISKPTLKGNTIVWKKGDSLKHESFGEGIILNVEGVIIEVLFKDGTVKKLLGTHPRITSLSEGVKNEC